MIFTTVTFLIFLAVVFGLYWLLPGRREQNVFLIIAGYAFYAWWDPRYCVLMVISTLVDYFCGLGCARTSRPKTFLVISLISNLGLLGTFKYFHFFQASLIASFEAIGVTLDPVTVKIVLPVGISFYTFQTLSYTIDVFRGKLEPHKSLVDYAAYVSFFPQLVAGPIERASSLLPQFSSPRSFCPVEARDGLRQILWGFFKKLTIADQAALVVEEVYGNYESFGTQHFWMATIAFSFQIYCDFSAYSDIAIGTARLFGFRLTQNFATPYFSQDFVEFWRRWHITLSSWFRDYVYIPLGGNRSGARRQLLNVIVVFTLSGLWHGAGWTFVFWGLLHGVLVAASSLIRKSPLRAVDVPLGRPVSLGAVLRCLCVFVITCLCWVFFRAETFDQAWSILDAMLFSPTSSTATLGTYSSWDILTKLIPVLLLCEFFSRGQPHPLQSMVKLPRLVRWLVYSGLIAATLYYMTKETGAFVYFQF